MSKLSCLFKFGLFSIFVVLTTASKNIPYCILHAAGHRLTGLLIPYGPQTWRQVDEGGTWGVHYLKPHSHSGRLTLFNGDSPYMSKYEEDTIHLLQKYDATTKCLPSDFSFLYSDGKIDEPKTFVYTFTDLRIMGRLFHGYIFTSQPFMEHTADNIKTCFSLILEGKVKDATGFKYSVDECKCKFTKGTDLIKSKESSVTEYSIIFEEKQYMKMPGSSVERIEVGQTNSLADCQNKALEFLFTNVRTISFNIKTKDCGLSRAHFPLSYGDEDWVTVGVKPSDDVVGKAFHCTVK